ncbi:MAG: sensor histidine kinase [Anaerocolumna sp.]
MIHQDNNMGFLEQLDDALNFLKDNEKIVQDELDEINFRIKFCEENLKQIREKLYDIEIKGTNHVFFSPILKNSKDNLFLDLMNQKKETETILKEEEEKFLKCISKKNSYDNLLNCFYTLKSNSIEDTSKTQENNNYCIENKINLDFGINILEAQENERKRIARDLHDSTVQNLTNMMHKTELCTRLIDVDKVRAKLELQTMISTIKSTINDMRNIIFGLRPMSLDDLGLLPTIERYIRETNKSHDVHISLEVENEENDILPVINLTLFRIVQEASNNAIKHGNATKIFIKIIYNIDIIELYIKDNGTGFKKGALKESNSNVLSGYGLSMMKERVYILSGDFNIESKEKEGTSIIVKIPLMRIRRSVK